MSGKRGQKTLVIYKSRRMDSVTVNASTSSISSVGSGEHGQTPNTLQSSVNPVSVQSDYPTTPLPPTLFPENDIGIHNTSVQYMPLTTE